jgi:spore maturation protein SpmA
VLAFEALHSYLKNSSPMSNYIWSDLFWLNAVCGFAAGSAEELGGGRVAQATSAIFIMVGTNPVGYVLMQLVLILAPLISNTE